MSILIGLLIAGVAFIAGVAAVLYLLEKAVQGIFKW